MGNIFPGTASGADLKNTQSRANDEEVFIIIFNIYSITNEMKNPT